MHLTGRHAVGETLINSKRDCTMFTLFIACVSSRPSRSHLWICAQIKSTGLSDKMTLNYFKLVQKNAFGRGLHTNRLADIVELVISSSIPCLPKESQNECLKCNQVSHVTQRLCIYFHAFPSDCTSSTAVGLCVVRCEGEMRTPRTPRRDITGAREECRDRCAIITFEEEGAVSISEHRHMFVVGCRVNPIPDRCGPML